MSRILVAVLIVAAMFGGGVLVVRAMSDVSSTNATRSLEQRAVPFDGRTVTCAELFPGGCTFDLQLAFDRWGGHLEVFGATDLGPWGRGVSRPEAAKLGLEACETSSVPGETFLEFSEQARIDHPEASSPQLFPFWDQARRVLCPSA
ncbi:hypothetical protein [Rhodococcus sp. ACT016]|uniref:hypothetical protein n=1 Tax=Rhodococcus sp. ACT016 TaxID=3134808 RepID=UPI003D2A6876